MPHQYFITHECDYCSTLIKNSVMDFTNTKVLEISVTDLSGTVFDCKRCGASYGVGDVGVEEYNGPESDWENEDE